MISFLASAAPEVSIGYTKKNSLILKADNCETLQEEYKKICDWKKTVDPLFSVPENEKPYCKTLSNGKKRIIISKCLPKLVKNYQKKRHYQDGPNCWGTAMSLKGISIIPRYVWSEEMVYWQESPLCRRLDVDEPIVAGDIMNIYGPEYIFDRNDYTKGTKFFETLYPNRMQSTSITSGYSGFHNFLHSETYISKRISFGKESPNKLDRFSVNQINEVYGRSRDVECQENQTMVPNMRENDNKPENMSNTNCRGYFSNAYRCENFNQYFEVNIVNSEQRVLKDEIEELKLIQKEVFKFQMVPGFTLPISRVKTLLEKLDRISVASLEELGKPMDKTTEMLHTLRYFTAHGIRKNLEYAGLTEATELL
jgi:hypothetical protein